MSYPKTVKQSEWRKYLGRDLDHHEKIILHDAIIENRFNETKMKAIYKKLYTKQMTIPVLTELHGNCFFESLAYLGLGDNAQNLRKAIAYLMYIFKDYKNLIPGQALTLKELFQMELYDEINYVYCKKTDQLFKNSYEIMCLDLCSSHSWSILPTNLIMCMLSRIFRLRFHFIKDTDPLDTTFRTVDAFENVDNDQEMKDMYLGHILESHYLPIVQSDTDGDEEEFIENCLYYKESLNTFILWAEAMERKKMIQLEKKNKKNRRSNNRFSEFMDFVNILE